MQTLREGQQPTRDSASDVPRFVPGTRRLGEIAKFHRHLTLMRGSVTKQRERKAMMTCQQHRAQLSLEKCTLSSKDTVAGSVSGGTTRADGFGVVCK